MAAAGINVALLISVVANRLATGAIHAERSADNKTIRIGHWEIELVFKELKSRYALDMMKTKKPAIVLRLIWTAILTLIISRRLHNSILCSVLSDLVHRYPPLLWSTVFIENGECLLRALMRILGFESKFEGGLVRLVWIYEDGGLYMHVSCRRIREVYSA
ncbi:MAG: hypothetical protein ACUVV6_01210 [Thermoplasmatota archaeon]